MSWAEIEHFGSAVRSYPCNSAARLPSDECCNWMLEVARVLEADPIGRTEALMLAADLCAVLPSAAASTVDRAVQANTLAEALMRAPGPVARQCASLDGLLGSEKWRPSPSDIIGWCEKRVAALRSAAATAERVKAHRREVAAQKAAPARLPSPETAGETDGERRARIVREAISGLKRDAPADPKRAPLPTVTTDDVPIQPSAELVARVQEMQGAIR